MLVADNRGLEDEQLTRKHETQTRALSLTPGHQLPCRPHTLSGMQSAKLIYNAHRFALQSYIGLHNRTQTATFQLNPARSRLSRQEPIRASVITEGNMLKSPKS